MSYLGITIIEFLGCVFVIWGFAHEDKFIKLEYNIKRIVVGNYRHWKRTRGKQK